MQVSNDWEAQNQARAFTAKQLQLAHPHLVPDTGDSLIAAAKNIRIELKAAFPKTTFSVKSRRFSGGDSIDVCWTDGPTSDQVDAIINRYAAGSFDGMTDSYTYDHSAWTDAFGDAKYVHSSRKHSDAAIASCTRTVFARYSGNLVGMAVPAVDDFKMGRLWSVQVPGLRDSLQTLINVELHRRTWAIAPAK